MRFEVRYPGGIPHEVDTSSTLAVIGRDPTCDVVLNDPKCSRRHAVVELTGEGLVIRDAGSSNGVRLNDKRVERSHLVPGDVLRLGDVTLKVLPETGSTLVVDHPEEGAASIEVSERSPLAHAERAPSPPPARSHRPSAAAPAEPPARPRQAPPPPRPPRRPSPNPNLACTTRAERERSSRPVFISVLSALWGVFALLLASAGMVLVLLQKVPPGLPLAAVLAGCILGVGTGLLMATGLWMMLPWARWAQVALAVLGLLNCPFTLASSLVLYYFLRPAARAQFESRLGRVDVDPEHAVDLSSSSETGLCVALLALVALGISLSASVGFWLHHARP
jgi:pSer/pThr/pTyr-binding forkhead associated (FHA) protein